MTAIVSETSTLVTAANPGLGPRTAWLVAYLVVNVIAAVIMIRSGYLIGDASELPVTTNTDILFALGVTLTAYIAVAWILFNTLTRVELLREPRAWLATKGQRDATFIGAFLLILQIAFLIFNLREGINVAGSTNIKTESKLNLIFVLLQPDVMLFVYYGYYRESKFFKYNLLVYVLSNFLRGWSGFLLTIAFFEWCRAYRRGTLRPRTVLAACAIAVLVYPLLLSVKWYIRVNVGATLDDVQSLFDVVTTGLGADTYFDIVVGGMTHIVDRLQQVSIVAAIAQERDVLQNLVSIGGVTPFWWEGLPQLAVSRGFGLSEAPTLGVVLTDVIANLPGSEFGSWSIGPGLAGWIVLQPLYTPFLFLYVGLLCLLSVVLAPGCQREGATRDMLWYAWLVFLIPGWITAFTGVICALAVLNVVRTLVR